MFRSAATTQPPALADAGGLILAPLPFAPLRVQCRDCGADSAGTRGVLPRTTGSDAAACRAPAAADGLARRDGPVASRQNISMPGVDGCELAKALRAADG